MKNCCLVLLAALALAGCSTTYSAERPGSYYDGALYGAVAERETESLFTSDEAILSSADIEKILAYRWQAPPLNRIGIVALGRNFWFGYSEELTRSGTQIQARLVNRLRSSPLVYDASYVPTLLIPQKRTVGHFREAAARYQADLIMVYQASCRTYDKYRLFSPDEAKSYCNVEAVLLDTRTGIVPFTVTASRDFMTRKQPEDLNFRETLARAELAALADALDEIGGEVVTFLGKARG
jgi:hypothetical protein